eukprot:1153447-Pelagomonas_calceolata.AAC.1
MTAHTLDSSENEGLTRKGLTSLHTSSHILHDMRQTQPRCPGAMCCHKPTRPTSASFLASGDDSRLFEPMCLLPLNRCRYTIESSDESQHALTSRNNP